MPPNTSLAAIDDRWRHGIVDFGSRLLSLERPFLVASSTLKNEATKSNYGAERYRRHTYHMLVASMGIC